MFGLTEQITTELGQVGTQFDGFAHVGIGGSFYNCFKLQDIGTSSGMTELGMENVGTLITRGVLIDVAAAKGVDVLPETYVITPEDLQQALARQNITLEAGDAILVNTGWSDWYFKDRDVYLRSSPGLGIAAAEWLIAQDPMLLGADNCCIEVRPVGVGPLIHSFFMAVNGMHLIENVKLDELAAAEVYEFGFIVQPLKLQGATGSTVAPTAVR
jgi:kynurenine formamidase